MQYHVARGLREVVAPRQQMSKAQWQAVLDELGSLCIFCGQAGTAENRGIVPDHLVPAARFGELVIGNTVPACQSCNDSRGDKEWRSFLRSAFPGDIDLRTLRVEAYVTKFGYHPVSLETALSATERQRYSSILKTWGSILEKARRLRDAAAKRRRDAGK